MTRNPTGGGIYAWEDPPPKPRLTAQDFGMNRPWDQIAAQLRSSRGNWARIVSGETQDPISYRIEAGYRDFTPAGMFETDVRRIDGLVFVWARMRTEEEYTLWKARELLRKADPQP